LFLNGSGKVESIVVSTLHSSSEKNTPTMRDLSIFKHRLILALFLMTSQRHFSFSFLEELYGWVDFVFVFNILFYTQSWMGKNDYLSIPAVLPISISYPVSSAYLPIISQSGEKVNAFHCASHTNRSRNLQIAGAGRLQGRRRRRHV